MNNLCSKSLLPPIWISLVLSLGTPIFVWEGTWVFIGNFLEIMQGTPGPFMSVPLSLFSVYFIKFLLIHSALVFLYKIPLVQHYQLPVWIGVYLLLLLAGWFMESNFTARGAMERYYHQIQQGMSKQDIIVLADSYAFRMNRRDRDELAKMDQVLQCTVVGYPGRYSNCIGIYTPEPVDGSITIIFDDRDKVVGKQYCGPISACESDAKK